MKYFLTVLIRGVNHFKNKCCAEQKKFLCKHNFHIDNKENFSKITECDFLFIIELWNIVQINYHIYMIT